MRVTPGSAGREHGDLAGRGVHDHEIEAAAAPAHRDEPVSVRVPAVLGEVGLVMCELPRVAAVAVDEMQLVPAGELGGVRDERPVRRPARRVVVRARRSRQGTDLAVRDGDDADLAPVEIDTRGERVRDQRAVG